MEKKKKSTKVKLELTGIILFIAALIIGFGYLGYKFVVVPIINYKNIVATGEKTVKEFDKIYESEGEQVILFASPYCPHCKVFKPVLEEIAKENKFEFYLFDAYNIADKDMESVLKKLDISISGVPHLIVIKDKKVLAEQSGSRDKETTIEFLKKAGVIKEVENEE